MKSPRSFFIILAALVLEAAGVCLVSAQDQGASTSTTSTVNPNSPMSVLTPDEREHRHKIEKQALAADPALKTEDETLRQQRHDMEDPGSTVTPDAKKAFYAKWHDHSAKVRAAALKIDPTLAPIYAKMDAWKAQHPMGPGGPNSKPSGT